MKQVIVKGKITKRTYCPSCFSILSWDSSEVEKSGLVKCPVCQGAVKCNKAEIVLSELVEDKDITAIIDGVAYTSETLIEGIKQVAQKGGNITLNSDLKIEEPISFEGVEVTIDLNNHTLDLVNTGLTLKDSKVVINGGVNGKIVSQASDAFILSNADLTLNEGSYELAKWGLDLKAKSKATFNNIKMQSKEGTITLFEKSAIVINNSELTALDNYVIGTHGTEKDIVKYITINNSIINGEIISAGYISCGIYAASDAKIIINGGEINSKSGCGILMRSGKVECNNVIINAKGNIEGQVGDAKNKIKCDGIAYDTIANYPDKNTLNLVIDKNTKIITENGQRIGLYLAEGDEANIQDKGE